METKHKLFLGIAVLMAFIAIYLFDVYAPQHLLPLYLLLLTWPLVFAAGRNFEKQIFENYLDYLKERGYLQDYSQAAQQPQPQRQTASPINVRDLPVRETAQERAQEQPEAWRRSRIRQRPPRANQY